MTLPLGSGMADPYASRYTGYLANEIFEARDTVHTYFTTNRVTSHMHLQMHTYPTIRETWQCSYRTGTTTHMEQTHHQSTTGQMMGTGQPKLTRQWYTTERGYQNRTGVCSL